MLGVSQGGPYLHDSSARTLDELLETGHPTGAVLDADDRDYLIDYLNTL